MSTRPSGHRSRGQSLVEFAFLLPVFVTILAAIVQFGFLFWAQNALTQVVRDTARWSVTRTVDCKSPSNSMKQAVRDKAREIALGGSLFGYSASNPFALYDASGPKSSWPKEGVSVTWTPGDASSGTGLCPPRTNTAVWYVDIAARHEVTTFFPGFVYLPQLGTCDANGDCSLVISSSARYRMEPAP